MRLKPATATATLGRNLNPDLDNQEQDLSFVTLLPVDPIPEPFTNPPTTKRHSRDNSFEFEFDGSTAKPDQEIIFCGRILTPGRISSSSTVPYTYDSDGANYNHNRNRRVQFAAPDRGLYDISPSANTSPSRSLLMGQAAAGRSKSFSFRHQQQQQAAASKPKLGPSKSFAYSSSRSSSGYAKVTPSPKVAATEGKKVVGGEVEAVAGGDGRALGRSRSFRKSVSFSRCFPIVSSRHDFY